MRYVRRDQWPQWIKERLKGRKNIEVKERDGNFYIYESRNVWNKKRKRPRKSIRYLGALKQRHGRIREHGHVAFLVHLLSNHGILEKLRKHFPEEWRELLAFSLNRVVHPAPLKRIGSWVEKTTLGRLLGIESLPGKKISSVLARIGTNSEGQAVFMQELVKNGEMLLYDGSVIHSDSGYNRLLEVGYDPDGLWLPKANITLLFSRERNMPIHFRLFFGSVREIRTMKAIVDEIGQRNTVFIADKGFYKNKLYEQLTEAGIGFVLPLPRDDDRINYSAQLPEAFEYHKRIVRCTSYKAGPYHIYAYEDQYLKYTETTEFYKLKIAGRVVKFNESWAGRIALVSNLKIDAKEAYLMWKTRDQIEKAFDILQNHLEVDHPYVSGEDVFRGYLFASFVSLIAYYLVLNVLKKHEINDKVSVEDILFEFSKIMCEERKVPLPTEIPAKVQELARRVEAYPIVTTFWES